MNADGLEHGCCFFLVGADMPAGEFVLLLFEEIHIDVLCLLKKEPVDDNLD